MAASWSATLIFLAMVELFSVTLSVRAGEFSQIFADASFRNVLTNDLAKGIWTGPVSASVWSGGTVQPSPDSPATTVVLAQSSIGQIVSGRLGFPGAGEAFGSAAKDLRDQGAAYRYVTLQTGQAGIGSGAWDIIFPGAIDAATGQPWNPATSAKKQNFFEEKLLDAARAYRVALHIKPDDAEAARGLLNTLYERMAPLTFAGNNAFVAATKARLSGQNSGLREIELLETNALVMFRNAAQVVIDATTLLPEAALLDGSYPYIPSTNLISDMEAVFGSYTRAVALQGEALQRLTRIKYLQNYRAPSDLAFNPSALTGLIDTNVASMRDQILLANIFLRNRSLPASDLPTAEYSIGRLLDLRSSILQGRISYVGQRVTTNGAPQGLTVSAYSPEYVPFLFDPQEFASFNSSFAKLVNIAKELSGQSATLDNSLVSQNRQFDTDLFQLTQNLSSIRSRYEQELGEVCGWVRSSGGTLVPDILLAALPPKERNGQHTYVAGESRGVVYSQWQKVEQAETDLNAAKLDLENIYAQMQKKQEIANQVAQGFTNIASLILENGEKIAALDQEAGEVQAMALRTTTRLQNQAATRGLLVNVGLALGTAVATSGASLANDGPLLVSALKLYDNVNTATRVAEVQGGAQRKLGAINAQKDRIAALERAQIQYEQAHQELLKTEEAVYGMVLQGERLKLNILMAEQRLDMAMGELANTTARIQYLLQEYQRAVLLEQGNPLRNADFRLHRDLAVRQAEETFDSAQEWAYLAGKAALYKINGNLRSANTEALVNAILQARNGSELLNRVRDLEQQIDRLYLDQGTQTSIQVATLSVRNYLIQNNYIVVNAQGEPDPAQSLFETAPDGQTSDKLWLRFLQDHLVSDTRTGELKLEFVFATSLDRQGQTNGLSALQRRRNPLFNTTMFNALISYSSTLPNAYGIRINVRGRSLAVDPSFPVLVDLRQEGASYVRSRAWLNDPKAVNIWNLKATLGQITASINGFANSGSPQYHERSPANDRWVFTISSLNGGNGNTTLLNQLDKITDIEIAYSIRGFTGGL